MGNWASESVTRHVKLIGIFVLFDHLDKLESSHTFGICVIFLWEGNESIPNGSQEDNTRKRMDGFEDGG